MGGIWLELGLGLPGLCIAGVVASRAQWRVGIFAVGLQMAINLNQVKLNHIEEANGIDCLHVIKGIGGHRSGERKMHRNRNPNLNPNAKPNPNDNPDLYTYK